MDGKTHNGMQCIEFEALLADAMDGALEAPRMDAFRAHAAGCPDCGPLFAEAQAGHSWLKSLPELEPPRHLVHNILAATSGVESAEERVAAHRSWPQRFADWIRPVLVPAWGAVRQPRFAMSFGMAFFSLSLVLNISGLKLRDIRHVDLRPVAIENTAYRGFYETRGKVVRYYENMRLVYELQSRVRDLRNATRPEEQPQQQDRQKHRDDNTSGQPERRNQYYSADQAGSLLAVLWDKNSIQLPALQDRSVRDRARALDGDVDSRRGA
jgi:hypothetical protein